MTLHCSKKKRASCSDKLTFLNRLFLNARTLICWLANFFVLFFLEDARILIFFLCSYCAALVFEIFDFFSFIFFLSINFVLSFFFFLMHSGDISSFIFILITKFFDFQNSKFDFHSSISFRTFYSALIFLVLAGDTALLGWPHQKRFLGLFGLTPNIQGILLLLHPWPLTSPEKTINNLIYV